VQELDDQGRERKKSLKDELPDLTPYLSKKGGNSQSKGSDNPADKADISSKLSALVKKTGTFNVVSDEAIAEAEAKANSNDDTLEAPISHEQGFNPTADTGSAGGSPSSWANIGDLPGQNQPTQEPGTPSSGGSSSTSWEQIDSFSASARTDMDKDDESGAPPPTVNEDGGGSAAGTSGFGSSGTFSTRSGARPAAPGLDKFKAPQARPMNTLSSGNGPVLKTPPKEPGRAPAPYGFTPGEAPKSTPPKAPSSSGNFSTSSLSGNANTSGSNVGAQVPKSRTGEQNKEVRKEEVRRVDPPPSWPAQPTSPPRVTEKAEPPKPAPVKTGPPTTTPFSQSLPSAVPSAVPSPAASTAPVETEAQILARAFMEEARALQAERPDNDFDDLSSAEPTEPVPSTSLGALFAAEKLAEEKLAAEPDTSSTLLPSPSPSPYMMDEEAPKRPLGFGNLLASAAADPAQSSKHSTLADLMVPTGEHQTLFAPDRRTEQGEDQLSPFDEVAPQPSDEPIRLDNFGASSAHEDHEVEAAPTASSAPAFSALFSTEIVTTGQDFSQNNNVTSEPEPASFEEPRMTSKSDVLSKLMEAVNQPPAPTAEPAESAVSNGFTDSFNSDFNAENFNADNFSDRNFEQSNYEDAVLDDMRTADTMFGSGGSNKGSQEELAAADAVFGEVADLGAPAQSEFKSDFKPEVKAPIPVLDIDALPMAFGDSTNFEQIRLEDIKVYKKAAKLKAAEEAKKAEAENAAAANKSSEAVEPPAAKLSLTEMIEQANAAKLEQVNDNKSADARRPSGGAKSSLSSLLSGGDNLDEVLAPAASAASVTANDADDDDEDSLGGAISDALDKLLNEAPPSGDTKSNVVSGGLSKLIASSSDQSQNDMAPAASASASASASMDRVPSSVDEPMTNTQANKVDALSRLLEVASKAPHKPADEKRYPSDSASKLAAEINRPPGKISRQVDVLNAPDYLNQGNQNAAPSPFTSPFTSPSATHNRQASQGADPLPTNPYALSAEMPQAMVSNDAVSARIAALNRKLEEGSRSPTASAMNIEAMNQAQSQAGTATGTGSSPSVNSLSQLPSQVDDSPSTRAELVNRILGSAKISQHGTKIPDTASRTVADAVVNADQVNAIRSAKGAKPGRENAPNRPRARVSRMPGFDPRPLIFIAIVLCVVGGGGFYAIQNGIIKLNFPSLKTGLDAKVSVDQLIKSGDLEHARELLEAKVKSGKITSSETEKLYSVYYQQADKIDGDDATEAIKLLEKIPSRSKKFKDAQKLVRKLKKKVKKN